MEMMTPINDVQRLYKQWQEGKLLDTEERAALGDAVPADSSLSSFSDALKAASDAKPTS